MGVRRRITRRACSRRSHASGSSRPLRLSLPQQLWPFCLRSELLRPEALGLGRLRQFAIGADLEGEGDSVMTLRPPVVVLILSVLPAVLGAQAKPAPEALAKA